MSITFYNPPQHPRTRAASAPTSLLNRIQKPPLLDRLSSTGPLQDKKKALPAYVLFAVTVASVPY